MGVSRTAQLRKRSIVALALLACLVALYFDDLTSHLQDLSPQVSSRRRLEQQLTEDSGYDNEPPYPSNFTVCGRAAGSDLESWSLQRKYATCPQFDDPRTPTLVLQIYVKFGRTGNHFRSLLRGFQYARDHRYRLAIMSNSWAMDVLLQFFMANNDNVNDDDWKSWIERTLCVKIVHRFKELEGARIVHMSDKQLFTYISRAPIEEHVASQLFTLRTFFQHTNNGEGRDQHGNAVRDMCEGIDSVFTGKGGKENRSSAIYSVVHLRYLEGSPGRNILAKVARGTGCDPIAALEMEPNYIKSILGPLGMLEHPIVLISDGQSKVALGRLLRDPDIGPLIRTVSKQALWLGGDVTLAVMGNVFIGNPASTLSTFIARSRIALGFGHNYMYRAKDEKGEWTTVCGNSCLFKHPKRSKSWKYYPPTRPKKSQEKRISGLQWKKNQGARKRAIEAASDTEKLE